MSHVCECDPGMCGGCDPTIDPRWLCSIGGCAWLRGLQSLRGEVFVHIRRYRPLRTIWDDLERSQRKLRKTQFETAGSLDDQLGLGI